MCLGTTRNYYYEDKSTHKPDKKWKKNGEVAMLCITAIAKMQSQSGKLYTYLYLYNL